MAAADGVARTLWLLWLFTTLPAVFIPWENQMREIVEDISQCFISAAVISVLCSMYADGSIGKRTLVGGVIIVIVLLVTAAKINSRIASGRRRKAEEGSTDGAFADILGGIRDTAKDVWERIRDFFGW